MPRLAIVCVDDQREVLAALTKDLAPFETRLEIVSCESGEEALAMMAELDASGVTPAVLISDHVMPGATGVEWLARTVDDERYRRARRILLTGLATHQDTIEAVNKAKIDRYVAKPWNPEQLRTVVKMLLTTFLCEEGLAVREYKDLLDPEVLLKYGRSPLGEE